jgi:hypothetical protein
VSRAMDADSLASPGQGQGVPQPEDAER